MRLTQYLASKLKNFSNLPKEYIERSKKQVTGRVFFIEQLVNSGSRNTSHGKCFTFIKIFFFISTQVYWQTPKEINYLPRTVERKRFRYTTNRSWTGQFRQQNMPGTVRRKVLVEPIGKE